MRGGSFRHGVTVWGKTYEVTVSQQSKTVWRADGDYGGESISVTDRSQSTALKRWMEAARYRGNIGPAPPSDRSDPS